MKKKLHQITMCLLSGLIVASTGCSSDSKTDPVNETDRSAMLTNLGNNLIVSSFEAFRSSSADLQASATAFAGDRTSDTKFAQLQNAWVKAVTDWKRASLFTQGPVDNNFLTFGIYSSTVNTTAIEKAIGQSGVTFNSTYIETLGAPLKGLPALEYLLFSPSGNATVLSGYSGTAGEKRAGYLKAVCENLVVQADKIVNAWKKDGENYVSAFIAADGRDINSSFGVLANKMIDMVYTIRDERLGAPLGKRTNGTPQPDLVDGKFSDRSVALIKAELKGLEDAFSGKSLAGTDGTGFDDILDQVGTKSGNDLLSAKIESQFSVINRKLDALGKPLSTAVVADAAAVSAIYDEVKRLQVLMEVDMINNLGVLLTFSDNDGD